MELPSLPVRSHPPGGECPTQGPGRTASEGMCHTAVAITDATLGGVEQDEAEFCNDGHGGSDDCLVPEPLEDEAERLCQTL